MTTAKKAAPKTPEVEVKRDPAIVAKALKQVKPAKRSANLCHYGAGAYTSPKDSPKCTKKRDTSKKPGQLLCAAHETQYAANLKARASAAKPKAAKPEATGKATKPVSERRAPRPEPKPIQRVQKTEPRPMIVEVRSDDQRD